jgi:uncharacterized protein (TIGR00369 family)
MSAEPVKADATNKIHPLLEKTFESSAPVARLIGFTVSDANDGQAIAWLQTGPQHANPMGTLHGGILCDLTDAAMGVAFATTLNADESFTTMDLHIHFFRPVWKAHLRAEAHVVHRGKNVGYLECDVKDENGKRVAKASAKCVVLRGDAASGR